MTNEISLIACRSAAIEFQVTSFSSTSFPVHAWEQKSKRMESTTQGSSFWYFFQYWSNLWSPCICIIAVFVATQPRIGKRFRRQGRDFPWFLFSSCNKSPFVCHFQGSDILVHPGMYQHPSRTVDFHKMIWEDPISIFQSFKRRIKICFEEQQEGISHILSLVSQQAFLFPLCCWCFFFDTAQVLHRMGAFFAIFCWTLAQVDFCPAVWQPRSMFCFFMPCSHA